MFAYQRQMQSQHAALVSRWLIARWVCGGHTICVADWDESNAFHNTPRDDLSALTDVWCPGAAPWARQFYEGLRVHVVPHGLSAPYTLAHGGDQGDSGGVGLYEVMGIIRTWYHAGV